MPSFNPTTITGKVRTGNAIAILVGDQVVGFGQTTSHSIDFGTEQFYGIGSSKPQENQQLKISPEITLNTYQLTDAGVAYFGYTSTWLSILSNTQLTFHLVDAAGKTLLTYIACTARNYSSSVPANQVVTEDTTFVALDVLDTNGKSVIDDSQNAAHLSPLATVATNFISGA